MSDDELGTPRLPFFVYGTLRPGEPNHAVHLHGRTATEKPALLPDALLYDGPGYPYAVEHPGKGPVHGELLTALPTAYAPSSPPWTSWRSTPRATRTTSTNESCATYSTGPATPSAPGST